MKISNVGSAKGTSSTERKKKTSATGGGSFADELRGTDEAGAPSETVGTSSVGGIDSILSVQEVPDSTEERSRRQVYQYADEVLDRLESIRRDLLTGAVPKEKLVALAQNLRMERGKTSDPQLREIIQEVELRAQVEIAKLTRDA